MVNLGPAAGLRAWPRRRWLSAVALVVPLGMAYGSVGAATPVWWSTSVTGASAVLAALVLASYVPLPGAGIRLDVGCSPCAVMAAATVLGSLVLRATAPLDGGLALVSLMVLAFGLVQRGSAATGCAVPVLERRTDDPAR
jgi:hypothetical protein